jgi:hypothetical protein
MTIKSSNLHPQNLSACCLLPAACCLLPAACCLLPAATVKKEKMKRWFKRHQSMVV